MKKIKPIKKTAKPAPKKAAAKAVVKPVKKAAKSAAKIVKKPVPKATVKSKAVKPVKSAAKSKTVKPVAKAAAKPVAKPAAKAKVVAPAKKPAPVAAAKPVKVVKEVAVKAAKVAVVKEAPAPKVAAAAPVEKPAKVAKVKGEKGKAVVAPAPADAFAALDPSVKRPAKPFFLEVKPGVERVIKRGDKSAASPVLDIQARRKGPAAEESSEELAERIERELQSQSFLKRNRMRPQLCTKCGINAVTPRFTIDRELGYCEICAEILHLGETKEARRMEFNLALKKDDPEAESAPIEGPPEGEEEVIPEELED